MSNARPDPDALLARTTAEDNSARRGRLKIFFGMCAGVGKTYAMLQEARERRAAGAEVVAGYVETHKRPETEALREGLEELPPKFQTYRGVQLREFDLDAALARRPRLLLVDELAHSNPEDFRHKKRHQDVLELLDAGIDVYTTVNVQHIESLNDVVAKITGIPVRETVPDSILDRADEIELVDIPPDDLLLRLNEGKVYLMDQARRAVERFFRRENLTALRELALRETAARVGEQVRLERAGRGDVRPWATAERILVCVGPSPLSARVIRIARRMASSSHAEWVAVSVDTPEQSEMAAAQVRRNLKLAERLGAEQVILSGDSVVNEILAYAVRHNITKIVVGKSSMSRWREWLGRSVVDELIRRSGEIDVHVVKGEAEEVVRTDARREARRVGWRGYVAAASIMAVCTLLAAIAFPYFTTVNLTMIYLAGVVVVATRFAAGPSTLASVLAAMLFNFFFTKPRYTFAIDDGQHVIAFLVLLVTALIISGLAQRVRRQSEAARVRYLRTLALYFMSRKLAALGDRDDLIQFSARHIADVFSADATILQPDTEKGLVVAAHRGVITTTSPNESAAAVWVHENQKWAGWSTDTLPSCQAIYVPLIASGTSLGVLAVRPHDSARLLEPDQRHLLETFATQLAIALERTTFAEKAAEARRAAEREQMRSSLLSSISHDFRTPLAAIAGSASALVENDPALSSATRGELAKSIADEAERLNQFFGKLLNMTRLESTGFKLQLEPYPAEELVGAALTRMKAALRGRSIITEFSSDLPALQVDGVLVEEVLANLLENAARYTPEDSSITIRGRMMEDLMLIEVLDQGPGLAPGTEKEIFNRFVRQRPATDRQGTGLGLSICEAIVRLHGGKIGAENRDVGGARFWFTLPTSNSAAQRRAGGVVDDGLAQSGRNPETGP